jgi:arginyl-tRNA synthetase
MSDPVATTPVDDLRAALHDAWRALAPDDGGEAGGRRPTLERPKKAGHGDYATNAALLLAPAAGRPPREVAEQLRRALSDSLGDRLERTEVAGPGFLNLFLADAWYADAVDRILAAGEAFGAGVAERPERILVEFVSANPTGPLTAASGRHAAYGDALARLLELAGHAVEREYYFNDAGTQVLKLGESIRARARGEEPPEDGYQGDYVRELAEAIPGAADADPAELARQGVELMFERIRRTLAAFRVRFDHWSSEASVFEGEPNAVQRAYARPGRAGLPLPPRRRAVAADLGLGDDKDRVLERSTGAPTYFASDIAYHEAKLERGYDRFVNVLGADHHGYVARMKAAFRALGADPDMLEVPMLQFVHIVEHGERASMSKRRGDFITLDELIGEIGVDATRFFMLSRSHDSTVDLDLDLAREESAENPVYYVQYAHARISSVLRKAGDARVDDAMRGEAPPALHEAERRLVARLLAFPDEVAEAAAKRAPHRITSYVLDLAQAFTAFYRDCQVVGSEPEALESFRLRLCVATRSTIARSLGLLGVEAPDTM